MGPGLCTQASLHSGFTFFAPGPSKQEASKSCSGAARPRFESKRPQDKNPGRADKWFFDPFATQTKGPVPDVCALHRFTKEVEELIVTIAVVTHESKFLERRI